MTNITFPFRGGFFIKNCAIFMAKNLQKILFSSIILKSFIVLYKKGECQWEDRLEGILKIVIRDQKFSLLLHTH